MNRHSSEAGFTLIEVLVAIVLLGVIMVAVLTPMAGLFGVNRTSESIMDVNTLAQQRLEEARSVVVTNYNTPDNFKDTLTKLGVTCKDIGLYGQVMQDSCAPAAVTPPLRRLSITVTRDGQTLTSSIDVVSQ